MPSASARHPIPVALRGLVGPFTKIARALSRNHRVEVIPSGSKCATDGRGRIWIPFNADKLTPELRQKMNGMLDHETAHVAEEREAREAGQRTATEIMKAEPDRTAKMLLNVYEDIRIEAKWSARYPGMAQNLSALNSQTVELFERRHGSGGNAWHQIGCAIICLARGLSIDWLKPELFPYVKRCRRFVDRCPEMVWPADAHALALETRDELRDLAEELKQKAEDEREKREHEDDDEPVEPEPEDDGECEDDEPDEAEGDGPEGETGEPEDGPEGDEGDEPEGNPEGDDGDDEDDIGEDDEDGEGSSEDDDPGVDDDGRGSSDGDDEGDEDGTEDGSDDEPEDGDDDEPGAAGDGAGEGLSEFDDGDDPEDDGDDGDLGGDDGDEGEPEDIDPDALDEGADAILGSDADDEDLIDATREDMAEQVDEEAREHNHYVPHPDLTHMDGYVDEGSILSRDDERVAKDARNEVRSQVSALRSKQLAYLQTITRSQRRVALRSGRLDTRALTKARMGSDQVWTDVRKQQDLDTAIEVLVDMSGSMGLNKSPRCAAHYAMRCAIALAEAWEGLGIPCEFTGFWNTSEYPRSDSRFVCRGALRYFLIKGWDEKVAKVLPRFGAINGKGDNTDGEAVFHAACRLAVRPEKRKILVVISDGFPDAARTDFEQLNDHLREVVKMITSSGIEVLGIGAGTDAPRHFYNEDTGAKNVVVNDISQMAVNVFRVMKEMLSAHMKRTA